MDNKVIIVCGPTGVGKTRLAIKIAEEFNGELINADSRQIYKYMDIGTNKGEIRMLNPEYRILEGASKNSKLDSKFYILHSMEDIPIHLLSFLEPNVRYSVFDWLKAANDAIEDIQSRGKIAIVVGGTGLYVDALLKNYVFENEQLGMNNEQLKSQLEQLNVEELQERLSAIGNELYTSLNESDKKNKRRLINKISKHRASKTKEYSVNEQINESPQNAQSKKYDFLILYPKYNWDELRGKIEQRVTQMFDEGLVKETEFLSNYKLPACPAGRQITNTKEKKDLEINLTHNIPSLERGLERVISPNPQLLTYNPLETMGYKQAYQYLNGEITLDKAIELTQFAHKQYARRQRTWFEGKGRNYNLNIVESFSQASQLFQNFNGGISKYKTKTRCY